MSQASLVNVLQSLLLGSIPFGYLLYRLRTGGDIRTRGSGNIGATNVLRSAGPGLGALTLLLDAAKGGAAICISYQLTHHASEADQFNYSLPATALLVVIAAHMFTPWLGFRGGKGVATAVGAFAALAPAAILASLLLFAVVAAVTRYISAASIAAAATLPLLMYWRYGATFPGIVYAATGAACGLVIVRHRGNIQRLRKGTENRLGSRKPPR